MMIKATVSYRGYMYTVTSDVLDLEEAEALAAKYTEEGMKSVRIAKYDMGDNKKLITSALSLRKKVVKADQVASRAAGRNTARIQSTQETKARARAAAAQTAYNTFCQANKLPVIW